MPIKCTTDKCKNPVTHMVKWTRTGFEAPFCAKHTKKVQRVSSVPITVRKV
jgi:hypothetical protein